MRGAFLLHKARRLDPGAMPAGRVFHAATAGGAEALGLARVGRLEPGWAADLQVVDARFPTPLTEHNVLDQLVLYRNHSHVRDVMVAGQWRVRGGEVLGHDLDELRAATQHQAERLWSRA
jgi:cytosine/adenosine deaminase-related metal-dependent hydrolase